MKRIILILLAVAAIATVVAVGFQAVEVDGAARLLIIAGAVVLLVGTIDGLRHPSLADRVAGPELATAPASTEPTLAPEATVAEPILANEATVAASLVDAVIDLRTAPATIDLREGATSLVHRSDLVDQLVADGLLRVIDGPISDDEVHTMVMVAVAQGALSELAPRIADLTAALRQGEGLVATS